MTRRVETCATCGGQIVGDTDDWDLNAKRVSDHFKSPRHATDPTVAALIARARRAERRQLKAEVEAARLRRQLKVVA